MAETKNILVNIPVEQRHIEQLEQAAAGGTECTFVYRTPEEATDEDIAAAHVIIGAFPPARFAAAHNLEWLQLSWAGADAVCAPGVLDEKVVITNASGAYRITCAEHMIATTFDLVRKFTLYHRNQYEGVWRHEGRIWSVEGSTVVALGVGDIGGDYARKMKALGAYTIGVRRTQAEKPEWLDEQITLDELDSVLPRADIVGMSLPGGQATTGVMDERRLRMMKPESFLVNIGRGSAIDTTALKKVLAEGHLAGVALDVFDEEPLPADDELWKIDRVFITPHVAGQLYLPGTLDVIVDIAANNLAAWTHDGELDHVVHRDLGY